MSRYLHLILLLVFAHTAIAEIGVRGEVAGFAQSGKQAYVGWHYLPLLEYEDQLNDRFSLQAEASYHFSWGHPLEDLELRANDFDSDLYRLNARLQTQQSEVVIGLQKLNFGPGRLLRPLMWFDELDPSDPLGIAKGVTGVTGQYFTRGFTQYRVWLLQSSDQRGWEIFGGVDGKVEMGARLALPVLGGELGQSIHHRFVDIHPYLLGSEDEVEEYRFALDGFFDPGIGLWFELMYKNLSTFSSTALSDQFMLMLGGDHTLGIGNGIHYTFEHLFYNVKFDFPEAGNMSDSEDEVQLSALMIDYPIGFFDQLSFISLYDWENENLIAMVTWSRAYDRFRFSLTAFDYSSGSGTPTLGRSTQLGGDGIQFLVTFNH